MRDIKGPMASGGLWLGHFFPEHPVGIRTSQWALDSCGVSLPHGSLGLSGEQAAAHVSHKLTNLAGIPPGTWRSDSPVVSLSCSENPGDYYYYYFFFSAVMGLQLTASQVLASLITELH